MKVRALVALSYLEFPPLNAVVLDCFQQVFFRGHPQTTVNMDWMIEVQWPIKKQLEIHCSNPARNNGILDWGGINGNEGNRWILDLLEIKNWRDLKNENAQVGWGEEGRNQGPPTGLNNLAGDGARYGKGGWELTWACKSRISFWHANFELLLRGSNGNSEPKDRQFSDSRPSSFPGLLKTCDVVWHKGMSWAHRISFFLSLNWKYWINLAVGSRG